MTKPRYRLRRVGGKWILTVERVVSKHEALAFRKARLENDLKEA